MAARPQTQVPWVYRDRSEWIPVAVPAIVPRELFETVHERLRRHEGALLPARHAA